jgi:hypothetical protein
MKNLNSIKKQLLDINDTEGSSLDRIGGGAVVDVYLSRKSACFSSTTDPKANPCDGTSVCVISCNERTAARVINIGGVSYAIIPLAEKNISLDEEQRPKFSFSKNKRF